MMGRTLSHSKVLEERNRGGRGKVCRAVHLKLDGDHPPVTNPCLSCGTWCAG